MDDLEQFRFFLSSHSFGSNFFLGGPTLVTIREGIGLRKFTQLITVATLLNCIITHLVPIGSGSGLMSPEITCSPPSPILTTEIFTPLSTLLDSLSCEVTGTYASLLYIFDLVDRLELLTEERLLNSFVADVLKRGENTITNITVCFEHRQYGTCDPDLPTTYLEGITISVQPSTDRLFPYGFSTGDNSFRGVLDGAVPIYPPDSVPFYSKYYRRLYVSNQNLQQSEPL